MGGAERQWSLLIPGLRRYEFDVSVLTLVDEGPFFDDLLHQGVQTTCVGMRHRGDLKGLRRALRHVELRPDIVVSHGINAHVVGHLIARKVAAPHVAVDHGLGFRGAKAVHRRVLHRLLGPRVTSTIVVSSSQIPELLALGYPEDRIRVIRNGVPQMRHNEAPSSVRSRLEVGANDFLTVLVAALRPEKSIDVFMRAVQQAHRAEPRIRGLVVGGGSEFAALKRLARDDGVVRLTGERLDIPDILNAADAVCLSSTTEATPLALLEAMAAGKAIVATEVGGVAEAVANEETGLLVVAGDHDGFARALLRLERDRGFCERLGRAGRERHRALFSMDRMVADYAKAFQACLSEADRLAV